VKAFPRLAEENPRKGKLRRVAGRAWAKPPRSATDSRTEQGPEGGRTFLAPMIKTQRQGMFVNDMRATASDELVRRSVRGTPWRAKPVRGCGVK
jgi:hypothetical protein